MELPYAQEVKRKKPNPSPGQEIMRFAAARKRSFYESRRTEFGKGNNAEGRTSPVS
jgi:hypothetical protein